VNKYRRSLQALRQIGRDCIMKRIKMIQNSEETSKDILSFMLSSKKNKQAFFAVVSEYIFFCSQS